MPLLVQELIYEAANRDPQAPALGHAGAVTSYGALAIMVESAGAAFHALGAGPQARVALYLPKREEAVCAVFGAAAAGCACVVLDPALPPALAAALLRDSGARVLVTSAERLASLGPWLAQCPVLASAVVCGGPCVQPDGLQVLHWDDLLRLGDGRAAHAGRDEGAAALLYTDTTPMPRTLALSHRKLVAGARALQRCLRTGPGDRLLTELPLSVDAGLYQLASAFAAGAFVVLADPMPAREVVRAVADETVTVLAASPPLWAELAGIEWTAAGTALRVAVSAGGQLTADTVAALRRRMPYARLVLLHGQPDALCATSLAQEECARHAAPVGRPLPLGAGVSA
jgi:acyl-CoA synthetase (AMP-forming)/AMP-acid ligase II